MELLIHKFARKINIVWFCHDNTSYSFKSYNLTIMEKIDYSWCYVSSSSNTCSKGDDAVVYHNCSMCDEHYVYCDDDCMIDYD